MKNKHLLILILLGTILAFVGLIAIALSHPKIGYSILNIGLSITNLLGLALFYKNSSTANTIYFVFISILIMVIMVGAMFKIMHWPGSLMALEIGLIGIPCVYMLRFYNKPKKQLLDIIKLIWLITAFITALGVMMHWFPRDLKYLPNLIMLAAVIQFALDCRKDKALMEQ